jgi:hypothetical protein
MPGNPLGHAQVVKRSPDEAPVGGEIARYREALKERFTNIPVLGYASPMRMLESPFSVTIAESIWSEYAMSMVELFHTELL